ncbi:MAG: discoidin domain-containing protein [Anaerolineaceae bacterium]|nr:discoidin domain-containing protein [Anaerolineaceae bacterium]
MLKMMRQTARLIITIMILGLSTSMAQDAAAMGRIGVRIVDGMGEFYNTATGERFVPRGTNYIDWSLAGNQLFITSRFDAESVRSDFQQLASLDYNTVRIFFDTCSSGSGCIGNTEGPGLNPEHIANIATTINIAAEESIYLILTSNDLPDDGGYWNLSNLGASDQIEGYRNAHYLTTPGVRSAETYWDDFLTELMAFEPQTDAILAWSILNEQWFFRKQPPFSLAEGMITTANGQTYDMSDPDQKQDMAVESVLYYIDAVQEVIRSHAPDTLVTMGFFAPQYPVPTETGGDWYVETAPLMGIAPLDFYDFHAYPGGDIDLEGLATNFGMLDYPEIPVIMGETGAFRFIYDGADLAAIALQEWIAESCQYGFDGWLTWDYFGAPRNIGDEAWGMVMDDGAIMNALAPTHQADPCQTTDLEIANVAYGKSATASNYLPEEHPENATDGSTETQWGSGGDAPQWLQINLDTPRSVSRVELTVAQWPSGETQHRVYGVLSNGQRVLLKELTEDTQEAVVLIIELPMPLADVVSIWVETLRSPSWVSWKEVEVYESENETSACVALANGANLRAGPSTTTAVAGSVNGGVVIGQQTIGDDGFIWYGTLNDTWVRSDVVSTSGDCDRLPTPE